MEKIDLLYDVEFTYTYKDGKKSKHNAKIWNIFFGKTEENEKDQWLLECYDYDEEKKIIFNMNNIEDLVIVSD